MLNDQSLGGTGLDSS